MWQNLLPQDALQYGTTTFKKEGNDSYGNQDAVTSLSSQESGWRMRQGEEHRSVQVTRPFYFLAWVVVASAFVL